MFKYWNTAINLKNKLTLGTNLPLMMNQMLNNILDDLPIVSTSFLDAVSFHCVFFLAL